jgi:hypothetical protein
MRFFFDRNMPPQLARMVDALERYLRAGVEVYQGLAGDRGKRERDDNEDL